MGKKEEFLLVIFGATGDLVRKKLIPSIYELYRKKLINWNFVIMAVGRRDLVNKEYFNFVKSNIKKFEIKTWNKFTKKINYFKVDFSNKVEFRRLVNLVNKNKSKNRLFYLATLPNHFKLISDNLLKFGLNKGKGWNRIAFEKPFGDDLKSAIKINKSIKKIFREDQIYRIDHYLGKELVQNIMVIRFANLVLSPLWNNKGIDHVQINIVENFGVGDRGEFYDRCGALKDVVQNHLIQLLCLITIDTPKYFDSKNIRNEKIKILKSINHIKKKDIILGQYKGYKKEQDVLYNSKTETFAALKLYINNSKWKGIPFYLRTGKELNSKFSSVYIQFKDSPCVLFNKKECNLAPNYLHLRIQPNEGISLQLNIKSPGDSLNIVPTLMDFCHSCLYGINTPEAYENLFIDILNGDQSVFVSMDEVKESWKIIERIKKIKPILYDYKINSRGPKEAISLIKKDGREWFDETNENY